jgi:hypothetical protein
MANDQTETTRVQLANGQHALLIRFTPTAPWRMYFKNASAHTVCAVERTLRRDLCRGVSVLQCDTQPVRVWTSRRGHTAYSATL